MLTVRYVSNSTSDCTTYNKDTAYYDSTFFMYSNEINGFGGTIFGSIGNGRNVFSNSFSVCIFS